MENQTDNEIVAAPAATLDPLKIHSLNPADVASVLQQMASLPKPEEAPAVVDTEATAESIPEETKSSD